MTLKTEFPCFLSSQDYPSTLLHIWYFSRITSIFLWDTLTYSLPVECMCGHSIKHSITVDRSWKQISSWDNKHNRSIWVQIFLQCKWKASTLVACLRCLVCTDLYVLCSIPTGDLCWISISFLPPFVLLNPLHLFSMLENKQKWSK